MPSILSTLSLLSITALAFTTASPFPDTTSDLVARFADADAGTDTSDLFARYAEPEAFAEAEGEAEAQNFEARDLYARYADAKASAYAAEFEARDLYARFAEAQYASQGSAGGAAHQGSQGGVNLPATTKKGGKVASKDAARVPLSKTMCKKRGKVVGNTCVFMGQGRQGAKQMTYTLGRMVKPARWGHSGKTQ